MFLPLSDLSLLIVKTSEEIRGNKTKFKTKKTYIKSKIKKKCCRNCHNHDAILFCFFLYILLFFSFFKKFPFCKRRNRKNCFKDVLEFFTT